MKKVKKVLFSATITGHINGCHIPYLKLFKENGYEVHVATGDNDKVIDYCDKKIFITVARSPYKLSNLKAIKSLKKVIDDEKYDIIHCHTPMGAVVTRLAARKARRKYHTRVIYTAHGFHFFKGAPLFNWLFFFPVEWYLSKFTDTLITINKYDYELAKKRFGKRSKDIRYVPGVGIDGKKFNFDMADKEKILLRKSLGVKTDDLLLIFPARLDKNKNQIFLINCMESIVKKHHNVHLLLPGADELDGYYQSIVNEKELDKNIHFLGYRNDIPKLMKIVDVAVSSSLREGLPLNVIESFACGLPVVALNCRGMKDLITDGENGYIVNSQDEFITKIDYLLSSDEIKQKIAKNNVIKFKNYELNKIIKMMKKIYWE